MKRLPLLLLLLLATAGASAACGSGSEPSAQPSPSTYAECLSQQGVTLPSGRASGGPGERPTARPSGTAFPRPSGSAFPRPSGMDGQGPGGLGQDNEAMQKAMQACAGLRPSANPGGTARGGEQLTAYLNCLKDKGITWNPGDPTPTAEAAKVCEVLRPSRPATN